MIRQALPEDADAIAETFIASLETLTFLPDLHTHEEHRRFILHALDVPGQRTRLPLLRAPRAASDRVWRRLGKRRGFAGRPLRMAPRRLARRERGLLHVEDQARDHEPLDLARPLVDLRA